VDTLAPISAAQRGALAGLKRAGLLDGLYLAGGVAVAHHLGHRRSNDLDLFSSSVDFDLEELRRRAGEELGVETVAQSDATLKLRIGAAAVDVVRYPYPLLGRATLGPEGVKVASARDLAVMKLAAIAKRGVRRDYWDLYELLTRTKLTLSSICDDYVRKFGVSESDLYHVLRALTWFEDAEAEPLPRGLRRQKWQQARAWFEREVAGELARRTRA
jgi:hypothetical protein